ncbi:MAG TPA: XdhC family protein [Steroidobacteraceae bacterium]|nr:XdhC family protein [Steroidobacteraceae bacterium]
MSFHRLLALFERNRESDHPLVLCTVIRTGGSTYAKPGAQMLIASDGEYAGLLSGGCLEGDLREHARGVAATGRAQIVSYDLRSSNDQLFGLGAGCEGAMDILLSRVSTAEHWWPLTHLADCAARGMVCRLAMVVSSTNPAFEVGKVMRSGEQQAPSGVEVFVHEIAPPPRLLLAGGGPDARPVATLASFLGWNLTVIDHRSSYLDAALFPSRVQLVESRAAELRGAVDLDAFAAAVVMSHHLESDLHYLRALARSRVPYVGLLGPAARREKLLGDLGVDAALLRPRLRAPVGLDIGGRTPESIALSIIGEVHAALAGRGGRPFSETAG